MKKLIIPLLISSFAFGQVNTTKRIAFKEGETPKIGVVVSGLNSITRVEVTFRNSLNTVLRKFSTLDATITLSDTTYSFSFTDLQTIGKAGRGTWQVEIRSEVGVQKTDVYTYEIYKATTLTSSTTPAFAGGYNYLFQWDFAPTTPTFNVIESGIIVIDNVSISTALNTKVDKVTGKGLSQNDYTNSDKAIVDGVTANLALKLNASDTTLLLRKTTASGLYVAKVTGKQLSTEDYTTTEKNKLSGIAIGATANSTDAQLRDRTTHTGAQEISTITGLQTALDAKAPIASPTFTGTVSGVTKAMVGLGNVDNTSDANKPVSTATQTALNTKPTLYNFATYALAASGMVGVTGRHIVYVIADEVNNGGQEGWYMWNGTTLKEILVL